jgi:hypothetical protein
VLGLLGFYDEFDNCPGRPNGSVHDAVRPSVETRHALLPEAFLQHVRDLDHRMPALITAQFAPHYNETMPLVGWASAVPWPATEAVLEPERRTGTSKAEAKSRKPRSAW